MIPKVLNFVWVGDENLMPLGNIETWRSANPDFDVKVWGNHDLNNKKWILKKHIDSFRERGEWNAVADLMRWEILYNNGGITLDADSIALKPLPEWILGGEIFTCWENEYVKPGLLAAGYVGAIHKHEVLEKLILEMEKKKDISKRFSFRKLKNKKVPGWMATGPVPFTKAVFEMGSNRITILPSHFFIPVHHSGFAYCGGGAIYSCELFGTTHDRYDGGHKSVSDLQQEANNFIRLAQLKAGGLNE